MPIQLPTIGEVMSFVEGLYATFGYPIVFLAALCENTIFVGLIFPGGTMVVLGGLYARLGLLSFPMVVLLGTLGTFLGASLDYWLAHRCWCLLRTRLPRRLSADAHLDRALGWLRRYGFWAVLSAHFVGHLRSLMAIAAGLLPVPYRRFALWELPAAFTWNVLYATLGYILADHLHLIEQYGDLLGRGVGALAAGLVIWRLWRWWVARTQQVTSG